MTTELFNYATIAKLHGLIGLIIFASGILQFVLKKGTVLHRFIGYLYLISWIGIIATGAYIGSMLIVAIVVLGFYLALTGLRAAIIKDKPYAITDKLIALFAVLVILFMLISAIRMLLLQNYLGAALGLFFSLLYSWIVGRDILHYIFLKPQFKNRYGKINWYVNHLTRMQFSFVTAVGAFTAVQNIFKITFLNFTLPVLLGFIVIKKTTAYFIKQAGIKENSSE